MKQYFDTSAVQIGFPLSNYGQQMRHLTVKQKNRVYSKSLIKDISIIQKVKNSVFI